MSTTGDSIVSIIAQLRDLENEYSAFSDEIDKEEVLHLVFRAVELHLQALRLVKGNDEKAKLSRKTRSLLDEAERIKSTNDWQRKPLPIDIDPPNSVETSSRNQLPVPISSRKLANQEQLLLWRGSRLNGFNFPPWERDPSMGEFDLDPEQGTFVDTPDLAFSEDQKAILDSWKRPAEALPPPNWIRNSSSDVSFKLGPVMKIEKDIDLVQDAATDCSVIASLCAGIARSNHGHVKLTPKIIFPYDEVADCPKISANGKYVVKLNFNGTYRKVVIDDRLPVSTETSFRCLHVVDRNNPALLWPALLEKAYLKVRGGYDFPGSNSGTDLWILTGWIPEQIFLEDLKTDRNALWKRLIRGFQFGDVMISLGTGNMTPKAEKDLGLAGDHDYAVLDLRATHETKEMLVKNPWSKATEWRSYRQDGVLIDSPARDELILDNEDRYSTTCTPLLPSRTPTSRSFPRSAIAESSRKAESETAKYPNTIAKPTKLSPGTFWMYFEDILQNFESLYLNWNPGLFKHRQDIHFTWDFVAGAASGRSTPPCFASNPQHTIASEKNTIVWLLLSRHFTDKSESEDDDDPMFISLHAFDSDGKRVYLAKGALERSAYVDSPQVLLRLELTANKALTIVTSEQNLPASLHTFTLSAFSNALVDLTPSPPYHPYERIVTSSWTPSTSGGNASSLNYGASPCFALTLGKQTSISLLLQTPTENLPIHLKLLRNPGTRLTASITTRDIVIDSGDYQPHAAFTSVGASNPVAAGTYTVVLSTFEAGQAGDFSLLVGAHAPFTLVPIPKSGAGRMRTQLAAASFGTGVRVLAAPLKVNRLTRLYLTGAYVSMAYSSHRPDSEATTPNAAHSLLRLAIELGRGPDRQVLVCSSGGDFSDARGGIRTDDVDLNPDLLSRRGDETMAGPIVGRGKGAEYYAKGAGQQDLWLVLERLGGGYGRGFATMGRVEERVMVEMFWEGAKEVVVGDWREWTR